MAEEKQAQAPSADQRLGRGAGADGAASSEGAQQKSPAYQEPKPGDPGTITIKKFWKDPKIALGMAIFAVVAGVAMIFAYFGYYH